MSERKDQSVEGGAEPLSGQGTSWWFAVNFVLAIVVITLALAWTSVLYVRASAVASGDPTSDPASPLTISGVSSLQGGIDGESVHVGATQRTLIVSFAASPVWHTSSRDCLSDIVGVVDWTGQTTWVGARAGHADFIVGDPSSASAYVVGLEQYCEAGRFMSNDGGLSWSDGSLPGNAVSSPTWLAFDPSRPHTLLARYADRLYVSFDSGLNWVSRQSTVTPLAFDLTGRLVGWMPGRLFESSDDGASWQQTGPGPAAQPDAAGADGVFVGASDGLWWYPLAAGPSLVEPGSVFSIATLGDGAVILGADSAGHPWLGAASSTQPGISMATLPPEIGSLQVTGGGVAVNDSGAVAAFSGKSSAIATVSFAR